MCLHFLDPHDYANYISRSIKVVAPSLLQKLNVANFVESHEFRKNCRNVANFTEVVPDSPSECHRNPRVRQMNRILLEMLRKLAEMEQISNDIL